MDLDQSGSGMAVVTYHSPANQTAANHVLLQLAILSSSPSLLPAMRLFFLFPIVFVAALAQSSSSSSSSPSLSLSLTTGSVTVTLATTVDNQPTQIVSVLPGIVRNVTYTITPSIAAPLPSISSTPLPSSTSDPYALVRVAF